MAGMKQLRQALLWIPFLNFALCARPREMKWSEKSFGPDGPWQAVTISIGSNSSDFVKPVSELALYPGAAWESRILLSSICDNKTLSSVCYGDSAGLFDSDRSVTLDNHSIELPPHGTWVDLGWGLTAATPVHAKARRGKDWIVIGGASSAFIPEVDLITVSAGWQTYPGGKVYPLQVGTLSLGASEINQTFGNSIKIHAAFINSYLYEQGGAQGIPSYSYGLHIGSAALRIPGSLFLGGYDQNRVIGEVSSQPFSSGSFPIQLLDIGIGVADGGSPWEYSNKTDLLAHANSSLASGLNVVMDPSNPYLYLPQSSCDAIAAELPVTYQPDYGLYFWNKSDPQYNRIVTSPSYLAFAFSKNGLNNERITINVPFALLNLTLEAPLVEAPTQYFPCMATNSTPALGRAFLQAAFIGVNWLGPENWYLAQAPGPGDSFLAKPLAISDNGPVSGSSNSWKASWSGTWVPIRTHFNDSTTESPVINKNHGLSTAEKVGLVCGTTVGVALIMVLVTVLCLRHRRTQSIVPSQKDSSLESLYDKPRAYQSQIVETSAEKKNRLYELNDDTGRFEVDSGRNHVELGLEKDPPPKWRHVSQQGPFELAARSSVWKEPNLI
ncbi:hypothetical protein N7492_009623 [Penicillium capsulatum]|uniref:Peptidase A1 domain-containing protein n=1 Tax=Penicillium capsulatum TaxID=69766 RepID=A0A9W9LIF9_9EURO|nr:hypothetical protein N7492_009623 [Penicillium capsulatum]KAJ6107009.1 hypothetical protein N7512_010526 [Penicillium capsulatum]